MHRLLLTTLLTLAAAAAAQSPGPAGSVAIAASTGFGAPVTLAPWGADAQLVAAAPGASAWTEDDDIRLSRAGGAPSRIAANHASQLHVATQGGRTTVAWVDQDWAVHADDLLLRGTPPRIRSLTATSRALAWIGVEPDGSRRLQYAALPDGKVQSPPQLGHPSYGVAAAGDGERTLLAWHAEDGGVRRIQALMVDAAGQTAGSRWISGPDGDATQPAAAMAADGTGALAWITGLPSNGMAVAGVTRDGVTGPPQVLSSAPGGQPVVAAGPGGEAVVAWPSGSGLQVAVRRAGEASFGAPGTVTTDGLLDVAAAIGRDGEIVVAWSGDATDAPVPASAKVKAVVDFGAPVTLGDGAWPLAAGGDALTWIEARGDERRVRYASLARPGRGGTPPPAADHRRPKVKVKLLGVRRHRLRVRITADERATAVVRLRRGGRTLARRHATLRPGRPRLLKLPARRAKLTVRVTDEAGNARTVTRRIRSLR